MSITENTFKQKLNEVIPEYSVPKHLVASAGLDYLPRYVAEFIISNYARKTDDEEEIIKLTRSFCSDNYPEKNSKHWLSHALIENGTIKLLGEFHVRVDITSSIYTARCQSFNSPMGIDASFVTDYKGLVTGGMWGLVTIRHTPVGEHSAYIDDFQPFQLGRFDFNQWASIRQNFSTKDWLDLLIISLGINHKNIDNRIKMLLISRLLPMATKNLNFAEFGPKNTGKTYNYRHLSSYSHVASGSALSPARLIYNLSTKSVGILSTSDNVVFDEINASDFGSKSKKTGTELIGMLKDYMMGGAVNRGDIKLQEDTALTFLGNIAVKNSKPKNEDYVRDLPASFADPAFLDRIHGIIPGWEMPKINISNIHFTREVGLSSNYLSEALHSTRNYNHPGLNWRELDKDLGSHRNESPVEKMCNSLLAILFPGTLPTDDEKRTIFNLACELRQNVYDQLRYIEPDEFPKLRIKINY